MKRIVPFLLAIFIVAGASSVFGQWSRRGTSGNQPHDSTEEAWHGTGGAGGGGIGPPPGPSACTNAYLQEDGSSYILQEDDSCLLLE